MRNSTLFLLLSIFVCFSQAKYESLIEKTFAPGAPTLPERKVLDDIRDSKALRAEMGSFLFALGDRNQNGMIDMHEFSSVYSHFLTILTTKPATTDLIFSRFMMGDYIKEDEQLDITEFCWVISGDFEFLWKNYVLCRGDKAFLSNFLVHFEKSIQPESLERIIKNIYVGMYNNEPIPKEQFKDVLLYIKNTVGILLRFKDSTYHGYATVVDTNHDEVFQLHELLTFSQEFFKNLLMILGNFAVY